MFYNGSQFPQLKGKLMIACLRGESILDLTVRNQQISNQVLLLKNKYGRIRSLVTGPDGYIYFSTSMHDPGEGHPRDAHDDMILRMRPSGKMLLTTQKVPLASRQTKRPTSVAAIYQQLCASCHGDQLQGTATAKGFVKNAFLHGGDKRSIVKNITGGIIEKGMPAWNGAISKQEIDQLADFILARAQK